MKRIFVKYYLFIAFLFLISCEEVEEQGTTLYVAEVGDLKLSKEEISHYLPENLSSQDSIAFVESYVEQWIQEQVIYQKALETLPNESKNVNFELEKYKRSLLNYTYEDYYIANRLDTNVSDIEIKSFYDSNLTDFILRDYIVKVVYAKYTDITPELDKVKSWYKFKQESDWVNFQSHGNLYSVNFHNDTSQWMLFDDVLKHIPLTDINTGTFIRKKKNITFEENGMVYFLNILDSRLQDDASPLEFEKERIKGFILNIRMNDLRKELHEELYNDALKQNKIKTH